MAKAVQEVLAEKQKTFAEDRDVRQRHEKDPDIVSLTDKLRKRFSHYLPSTAAEHEKREKAKNVLGFWRFKRYVPRPLSL